MSFIIPLIFLIISIIAFSWTKKNNKLNENKFTIIGILLFSSIIIFQCVKVIPAGTVGVVDIFGNVDKLPFYYAHNSVTNKLFN